MISTRLRLRSFLAAPILCLLAHAAPAQTLRIIYPFGANQYDASGPKSKLLEGPDGAFYGTSLDGGEFGVGFGDGTIFRVTAQGAGGTIYSFSDGNDGDNPSGGLALGPDGETMYGAADNGANGNGVIFTVTTTGSFNTIHALAADGSEGIQPNGDLVLGPDGQTFYGTCEYGGTNGNGVVFSVSVSGSVQPLYSFSATTGGENSDGAQPTHGLTLGDDGNLYGVTPSGGQYGNGMVYKITTSGSLTPLHSFSATDTNGDNLDGTLPDGELAKAPGGVFYGVANGGGEYGVGLVYRITETGAFTPERSFLANFTGKSQGFDPIDVVLGPDGVLCGTTQGGADATGGAVYLLNAKGDYTDYSFGGGVAGQIPTSGMVVGSDGNYYGTTSSAGADGQGTFFEVEVNSNTVSPFSTSAGRYFGLLAYGSGSIAVDLAASGKISGKVMPAVGPKLSFRGVLNSTGGFSAGSNLSLQLQLAGGVWIISGTGDDDGFTAYRSAYDAGEPLTEQGDYTAVLSTGTNYGSTPAPAGLGDATMKVTKTGVVSLSGKLPDQSPIRTTGLLLQGTTGFDQYLFFDSVNLNGSITFDPTPAYDCAGNINWIENADKSRFFPEGFRAGVVLEGSLYVAPARDEAALPITSGTVTIVGGGLPSPITDTFTLSPENKVIVNGSNKVKIAIDAAKGTFTGSLVGPDAPKATSFSGILYQNANFPAGFGGFLGPLTSGTAGPGSVSLAP